MPHAWSLVSRGGEWGVAHWRCLYCYMDAWGDDPDRIEDNCTRSH